MHLDQKDRARMFHQIPLKTLRLAPGSSQGPGWLDVDLCSFGQFHHAWMCPSWPPHVTYPSLCLVMGDPVTRNRTASEPLT
jgi:hypothetical protein